MLTDADVVAQMAVRPDLHRHPEASGSNAQTASPRHEARARRPGC